MISGLENPVHLLLLLFLVLVLFGSKRLPEMGRSLGTGMREFKESISGQSGGPRAQNAMTAADAPAQAVAPERSNITES